MPGNGDSKRRPVRKGEMTAPRSGTADEMSSGEIAPGPAASEGEMPKGAMTPSQATPQGEMPRGEMSTNRLAGALGGMGLYDAG